MPLSGSSEHARARPSATDGRRPKCLTLGFAPQVRSTPPVFDAPRIRFDDGHVAIRTACEAPTPPVCAAECSPFRLSRSPGITFGVAQAGPAGLRRARICLCSSIVVMTRSQLGRAGLWFAPGGARAYARGARREGVSRNAGPCHRRRPRLRSGACRAVVPGSAGRTIACQIRSREPTLGQPARAGVDPHQASSWASDNSPVAGLRASARTRHRPRSTPGGR